LQDFDEIFIDGEGQMRSVGCDVQRNAYDRCRICMPSNKNIRRVRRKTISFLLKYIKI